MGYTVEGSSASNVVYGHEHRLFVGPKIRKDLMQRADNLELAIDMGWFWFLAQPMVFVMDFINGYVNSWGLTIIIFTLFICLPPSNLVLTKTSIHLKAIFFFVNLVFYNFQMHFDLYLITAGYLGNIDLARNDFEESQKIINSNFTGIIPWINAIASPERIKQKRSIWVFTSVAADRGRPSNYFYGAAKAGLQIFCEGLLLKCYGKPFSMRIIKAGYIYTHMTIGKAPAILCVKPDKVAQMLLRNPYKRGVEYLPWWWNTIMMMVKNLPSKIAS